MKFDKPPTTIEEQIELLKKRGMTIDCADTIEQWLRTVGYYRISAYWLPFEEQPESSATRSKQFIKETRFDDVIDIYTFDRKLRLLVTEAIERIEINVRSRWTNRFTLESGSHAHMNPQLFVSGWDHAKSYATLAGRTGESREVFIQHYKRKYTQPYMPPLWAVSELMTFGELSKWVEATKNVKIRGAIAKDLGLPTQETLIGTLQLLSYVRNICAHHGRLWNRKTVKRIPNIKRFKADLEWDETGVATGQKQLSNQIYNVLTVLILLMRHQASDTTFPQRMNDLIQTRSDSQRASMGFPENWRERPAWT